jgi:hypothetical protein
MPGAPTPTSFSGAASPVVKTAGLESATTTDCNAQVSPATHRERANIEAERLESTLYPAQVGEALGMDKITSVATTRLYLARMRARAGATADPVEKILLDNLNVANLKIAEVYGLAASTKDLVLAQKFLSAANRMLHSICELTTTLCHYRESQKPCEFGPEFPNWTLDEEKRKNGQRNDK